MYVIKGMIQVLGNTYRVVQLRAEEYTVIRIHDDTVVGGFSWGRTLETSEVSVSSVVMRELAHAAMHQGRTSWLGKIGSIFSEALQFPRVGAILPQ